MTRIKYWRNFYTNEKLSFIESSLATIWKSGFQKYSNQEYHYKKTAFFSIYFVSRSLYMSLSVSYIFIWNKYKNNFWNK